MALSVEREVIKTGEGKIKFWKPSENGREHYQVAIWIDGSTEELDSVARVEYSLHPSFAQRVRASASRTDNFLITIWTWGMFMIDVTIFLHSGSEEHIQYYLSYELPPDDGSNYAAVEP